MTKEEAMKVAHEMLEEYGENRFQVSMPDQQSYEMMRTAFSSLGRESGPDGEFFVIKVPEKNAG